MAGPWEQFAPEGAPEAPWQSFRQEMDTKSGAPSRVRLRVGSAPEADKLANLRTFYPDAQPYGEGNFVFTDPASGRPTLFNPEGLDAGDVAGTAREITQAVGGTLGAAGGALAGLATGPGAPLAVPLMTAAGAGAGTATAGAAFDASMNLIGGMIDTRTLAQRLTDTAIDFGGGALGQRAGDYISAGAKALVGGGKRAVTTLVDSFNSFGIKPPAGAVTGSRAVGGIEKALESSPMSAQTMQENAATVLQQTRTAAERLTAQFGQARTAEGAGATIKQAAISAAERFGFRQEEIYDRAFDLIGADTRVPVASVTELRTAIEAELARAPESLANALRPALRQLDAIEADAANGGIPFGALREVRTMIGRDLDAPLLAGATSSQNVAMRRIYGALTEDLSGAARQSGPDAARILETADRYTRLFMNTAKDTLQKIADFDADERAFQFAMTSARDGGSTLARLRRNFTPEEWDTVAASVLGRMGQARPGAQDAAGEVFSVSTFLTNWNKLAPEAKEALFGGRRYADLRPELDRLTEVIGSLKGMERLTNTSNTAQNLIAHNFITTVGAALGGGLMGGYATGDVAGSISGAGTLVGAVMAPKAVAKLITSPSFVRWLTTPVVEANGIGAHLARLAAIGKGEPAIREEIGQLLSALRTTQAPAKTRAKADAIGTPSEEI